MVWLEIIVVLGAIFFGIRQEESALVYAAVLALRS